MGKEIGAVTIMAQSRSGSTGKSEKSTYRSSTAKNSKSTRSTSSSQKRTSGSGAKNRKKVSRREQRRAQQQNLTRSVVLACLGLFLIALVLVPGQSFWNTLRGWLFGVFGKIGRASCRERV